VHRQDAQLLPPPDLLAPPLDSEQQQRLYSFTAGDYMSHCNDLLRCRVCAALLLLVCLLVLCFFKPNWLVVLGCLYLMLATFLAFRATLRSERKTIKFVCRQNHLHNAMKHSHT
jgi:hypothetical protein